MNLIAVTKKGLNKVENEDRVIVGKSIIADGIFQTQLSEGIIAIADGVGGGNAGAVASHFVAKELTTLNAVSVEEFKKINEALLSCASSCIEYENMATTLSGIALIKGRTLLFNIGNTRVYLLQGKKYLKQLTTDDTTLNYLLTTGKLALDDVEAFKHKNEITACFGGGDSKLLKIKCNTIETLTSPFILTSDGIHDYISTDQMEDIITEFGMTITTCEVMITTARNNGSVDDVSIVLGVL